MGSDLSSTNSPLKPYEEMLVGELREGMSAYRRSSFGLFVSSISAGIDLSFSVLMVAVGHALLSGADEATSRVGIAALYPVGFVFVILGRAELFTEQTTLAIVPVLHGRASPLALCRLWGIVYAGNLIGMAAMAALFAFLGPALGIVSSADFEALAKKLTHPDAVTMLLSGAVAGWLMGLLSWLLTATRDTTSQILLVWLIAAMIGIGGFHHSIVGAGEVLAGLASGQQLSLSEAGYFLLWTTLGNVCGAFVFALLLKYSEGTRGARLQQLEQLGHRQNGDAGEPADPNDGN